LEIGDERLHVVAFQGLDLHGGVGLELDAIGLAAAALRA
jgi:hypothetical protein